MRAALALLLIAVVLAGCGRSNVVKRERGVPASRPAAVARAPRPAAQAGEYVVRRGDTLYGIAFRHGLDYRQVATWNRIGAPYTIYPGQRLRLRSTPTGTATVAAASVSPGPSSPPAASAGSTPTGVAAAPPLPATTVGRTGTIARGTATTTPGASGAITGMPTPTAAPRTSPSVPRGPVAWRWPAQGQIVGRYSAGDPTRQGLDIAGNAGQPVLAAGDGVVVYSGAGLVGYGELIIVKHTDEWLSAYGHNRKRLVNEGQVVKAGAQIAEMGRSGASRDMLHFEIRRNGKPVDPLPLLPGR